MSREGEEAIRVRAEVELVWKCAEAEEGSIPVRVIEDEEENPVRGLRKEQRSFLASVGVAEGVEVVDEAARCGEAVRREEQGEGGHDAEAPAAALEGGRASEAEEALREGDGDGEGA